MNFLLTSNDQGKQININILDFSKAFDILPPKSFFRKCMIMNSKDQLIL